MPDQNQLRAVGAVTLQAAKDDAKQRRFEMVAYTGGLIMQWWSNRPLVVDLAGMSVSEKSRPILLDHDASQIVGHTDSVVNDGAQLVVSGPVSGAGEHAAKVINAADAGFPWQSSIGADILVREDVNAGVEVEVNGKKFTGPLVIARKTELKEVSFVALGADDNTSGRLVAAYLSKERPMPDPIEPQAATEPVTASATPPAPAAAVQASASVVDIVAAQNKAAAENLTRIAAINAACKDHPEIAAKAIGEGWSAEKAELEALRAGRAQAPAGHVHGAPDVSGKVIEAAVMLSAGVQASELEQQFDERTLEASWKTFRNRASLSDIFLTAARANGYSGPGWKADMGGVLRAAASGFSTIDITGILSNTANKFLLQGYMGVERGWERIAKIRSVQDFKTVTSYRLTGDAKYAKIGPGGEIPHGSLGDQSYTNKADTYGRMFGISRTDLINDDLSALTDVPQSLGRGAALKLNDVFWTEFLADAATFFSSGNGNYITGATTAMSSAGLQQAEVKFQKQTDPDGNPLGLSPALLVVPPEISVATRELLRSTLVNANAASGGTTREPDVNVWAGAFDMVVSSYLSNSNFTGYSTTAWYMLANPMDLPMIEIAFLNGQRTPTVETADVDFNTLGVQMRGYHDFGVSKQEYRAAVKSKGAA